MSHFLDYSGLSRFFTGLKAKFVDKSDTITTSQINTIISSELSGVTIVTAELSDVLAAVYPVGSYYISESSTSPASLFGGSWTQLEGRFLLGANSTYAAGSTGGEATHTLTIDEMPSHDHDTWLYRNGSQYGWLSTPGGSNIQYNEITAQGGGQAHNNMPPYRAVYIWYRVS